MPPPSILTPGIRAGRELITPRLPGSRREPPVSVCSSDKNAIRTRRLMRRLWLRRRRTVGHGARDEHPRPRRAAVLVEPGDLRVHEALARNLDDVEVAV